MRCIQYGYAIALAWPETRCKRPNSWYDGLMDVLGVCTENYYKVGHAALALINPVDSTCHYYDFGRYHSPFGYGRVRSAETDHELKINTRGIIDTKGRLINFESILQEIQSNESCHGVGPLHAANCKIVFHDAYRKAEELKKKEFIKYGPFILNGTNCSRFVREVIASACGTSSRIRMYLNPGITPRPMDNIRSLKNQIIIDGQPIYKHIEEDTYARRTFKADEGSLESA